MQEAIKEHIEKIKESQAGKHFEKIMIVDDNNALEHKEEVQNTSLFNNEELKQSFDSNKVQSYDELMEKKIRKRGKP